MIRGDEAAIAKARELDEANVQQRLASITLFELYHGLARSDQPEREREAILEVLESKPVHLADSTVMRKSGRRSGDLTSAGTKIADGDVIIGMTALVLDEPVLTRNTADFGRIDDIQVVEY